MMNTRKAWLYLSSLIVASALVAAPAAAQPGEGWEPAPCPEEWRPGPFRGALLIGSLTEFRGYLFNVRWVRSSEARVGLGFYRPQGGIVPVEPILHRVEWRSAGIVLQCWKKLIRRVNGPSSEVLSESIIDKVGRIAEHNESDPPEGECEELEYGPYDPYSPTGPSRCPSPEDPGAGTGGGGGDGGAGDKTGCRTEYLKVEISYDDGVTWVVYWEGYATVCD